MDDPLRRCENCEGDGGFEVQTGSTCGRWGDPTPGGEWVDCPECDGSGFVEGHEHLIEQEDLEMAYG